MDNVIRFNGHISWEGRMNGLPETIYAFIIMRGYDKEAFNNAIEAQSAAFLRMQAMIAQREQGKIIDINQVPAERMAVPMKWIVYIDVDVLPMTGELSTPDAEGVERLASGEEPTKQ